MKTLRLFGMLLLAISLCLSACGEIENPIEPTPDPKPEEVKSEITIDADIITNGLSFTSATGEKSISFTTNEDWTLSIATTQNGDAWCSASTTSGTKGNVNVKFSVTENTSYDDRSVSVTIKSGTASKTFTITQKYAEALLLTTNKYELSQEGGTIEIEVKANIDYEMEIAESAKDWITEATTRALSTYKHSLNIATNEEVEKREGEIYFKSGDKVEIVKVYQAGGALILLSKGEYTVSANGETISVDIKSNIEYGVQMPDVDWITEVVTRGMSSHSLQYNISPNEEYDNRSAEIIFYDKNSDLKETLKVTQAQKDAIVISEKNISIAKEGGIVGIKVNTNVDIDVQIPTEYSWVTLVETRSLDEKSVSLAIEENTSQVERRATITITNERNTVSETVIITQEGNIVIVELNEAGTLKDVLGDSYLDIMSLKIIGPINGDDINYLRKMIGVRGFREDEWGKLTTLDLSEASIESGGQYRVIIDGAVRNCKTIKNKIPDYMFFDCKTLKKVDLPNNVLEINEKAFYGCTNLETINLPDCLSEINSEAFYGCSILNAIDLPDSLSYIGSYAFSGCGLSSIKIPQKITYISNGAFSGCRSLKSVKIPHHVTEIRSKAFADCSSLVSIYLGRGVEDIYSYAFRGTNVTDFYCLAMVAPKLHGEIYHNVGGSANGNSFKSWNNALDGLSQATLHIFKGASGYDKDLDSSTYLSCTWRGHFTSVETHSSFIETDEGWR